MPNSRWTSSCGHQRAPSVPRHARLKAETVRIFGLGCYTGDGVFHGRIVIPIHHERGALVAYAGRAIDEQQPKYRFPAGFRKSLVLFNLHRALKTGAHTVIVVEGLFERAESTPSRPSGRRRVDGSRLSRYQHDLLHAHFRRVLLMLDGDDAGRQGVTNMASVIAGRMPTTIVELENGAQPDQLAPEVIQRLVGEPALRARSCAGRDS